MEHSWSFSAFDVFSSSHVFCLPFFVLPPFSTVVVITHTGGHIAGSLLPLLRCDSFLLLLFYRYGYSPLYSAVDRCQIVCSHPTRATCRIHTKIDNPYKSPTLTNKLEYGWLPFDVVIYS